MRDMLQGDPSMLLIPDDHRDREEDRNDRRRQRTAYVPPAIWQVGCTKQHDRRNPQEHRIFGKNPKPNEDARHNPRPELLTEYRNGGEIRRRRPTEEQRRIDRHKHAAEDEDRHERAQYDRAQRQSVTSEELQRQQISKYRRPRPQQYRWIPHRLHRFTEDHAARSNEIRNQRTFAVIAQVQASGPIPVLRFIPREIDRAVPVEVDYIRDSTNDEHCNENEPTARGGQPVKL